MLWVVAACTGVFGDRQGQTFPVPRSTRLHEVDALKQGISNSIVQPLHFTNVALINGELHVHAPSPALRRALGTLSGRLPHFSLWNPQEHVLPAPRIVVHETEMHCQPENEIAYFYTQYSLDNNWHVHNDQILPFVHNIQHTPNCDAVTLRCSRPKTLYWLYPQGTTPVITAHVMTMLVDKVRVYDPSKALCVKQLVWGRGPRFFYHDAAARGHPDDWPGGQLPVSWTAWHRQRDLAVNALNALTGASAARARTAPVRVLYMSRTGSRSLRNPQALADSCKSRGWQWEPCCDWSAETLTSLLDRTRRAHIIIGAHGAGLSNIIYMPAKSVLIDFGLDTEQAWQVPFELMVGDTKRLIRGRVDAGSGPWTLTQHDVRDALDAAARYLDA